MLSSEIISKNKQTFIDLVSGINRLDEQSLHNVLTYLEQSDFYIAPASAKYHGAYDGGLCEHCLNVYYNLLKLHESFHFDLPENDYESLLIVGLFHDLAKVNFYIKEIKHRKVYDSDGKSHWEDYIGYGYKDDSERFMLGNHEENCAYLLSTLMPLRIEEYAAVLNHHGGMGWDSSKAGTTDIFQKYPLAHFLHIADTIDAYHNDIVLFKV